MAVRMTRRTKPARSSRGKSPGKANIHAHMTKRTGIQPGSGINGSSHGTSAQKRTGGGKRVEKDDGRRTKGQAVIARRKRLGQF